MFAKRFDQWLNEQTKEWYKMKYLELTTSLQVFIKFLDKIGIRETFLDELTPFEHFNVVESLITLSKPWDFKNEEYNGCNHKWNYWTEHDPKKVKCLICNKMLIGVKK